MFMSVTPTILRPSLLIATGPKAAVFNVSDAANQIVLTGDNRTATSGGPVGAVTIRDALTTGKFYAEFLVVNATNVKVGVMNVNASRSAGLGGSDSFGYSPDGSYRSNRVNSSRSLTSWGSGSRISIALDIDALAFDLYVNGGFSGSISSSVAPTGVLTPAISLDAGDEVRLSTTPTYEIAGYTFWPST